jgi:photosystem II stability/assembly factor-like uncharacterized protein
MNGYYGCNLAINSTDGIMKNYYLMLVIIILLNANFFSQNFWQPTGPLYNGSPVYALAVINSGWVFAGCGDQIFRSTDNGNSWVMVYQASSDATCLGHDSTAYVYAGFFNSGVVMYHADVAWQPEGLSGTIISDIVVTGSGHVFAATQSSSHIGGIFKSTDNGQTWTTSFSGNNVYCLNIDQYNNIYAGYISGTLLKSTYDGKNWNSITVTSKLNGILGVGVDLYGNIFALQTDQCYKSSDGGATWKSVLSGLSYYNKYPFVVCGNGPAHNLLLIGSNNAGIFLSADRGETWSQFNSGLSSLNCYSLAFSNSDWKIYAGLGSSVYKGTFNWMSPPIIGTVLYGNATDVGAKNVLVTINPGAQTVTTPAGGEFLFINIAQGSYILSASDALLVSNAFNGKITFSPIQTLAGDVNKDGRVNNTDALLIVRRFVGLDNSFAAGDWVFTTANVTYSYASVTQNLQGLVTGDVNCSDSTAVLGLPKTLPIVTAISDGVLKVNPEKEFEVPVRVSATMSLGAVSLRFSYPSNLASFEGVSTGNFINNDVNGKIAIAWADLSGGKQPINLNTGDVLLFLKFKPTANLKMGSQFSLTLDENSSELADKYGQVINNAKLSVPSVEVVAPTEFVLYQNYPNPLNPVTVINYQLADGSLVTLKVYDVMGREVKILVNKSQEAGNHSVSFDASNCTSGVYFYQLRAGSFTSTKKMIVLK